MKSNLILVSLIAIFVIGGMGIFLSISNTTPQNPIDYVYDEPNFSVYQTTPSRYYVDDEPNYSEILGKIKSIPEGNAFILKNTYLLEIYEHRSKFSSITTDNDSITLSASGGYTGEKLTIYTFSGLPIRIVYSCWTDEALGSITIESNIMEVLEKSSCEMKLRESIQR